MGTEQNSNYYDKIYQVAKKYRRHYSGVRWLPMFEKAATMVGSSVLELGCGVGQFAHLLHDKGIRNYTGIDFSPVAIERCLKLNIPKFNFKLENIYNSVNYQGNYDTVVALETLEHVMDMKVIDNIKPEIHVIFSLPTFTNEAHLIHFTDANGIVNRYNDVIKFNYIEKISDWFLFSGTKK